MICSFHTGKKHHKIILEKLTLGYLYIFHKECAPKIKIWIWPLEGLTLASFAFFSGITFNGYFSNLPRFFKIVRQQRERRHSYEGQEAKRAL